MAEVCRSMMRSCERGCNRLKRGKIPSNCAKVNIIKKMPRWSNLRQGGVRIKVPEIVHAPKPDIPKPDIPKPEPRKKESTLYYICMFDCNYPRCWHRAKHPSCQKKNLLADQNRACPECTRKRFDGGV